MRPTASLALTALITLGLLTGCTSAPDDAPTSPAESSAPAETTPAVTPTETTPANETPTPAPGTPIGISCDQLLTPDDVYAFNPNFGTAADYSPSGEAAKIVADNGLACAWSNQTSGDVIEIAVQRPSADQLAALRASTAASSTAVPTYGTPPAVDGFFTASQGVGTATVFTDEYRLIAASAAFFEPGDAAQLVAAALSNLP